MKHNFVMILAVKAMLLSQGAMAFDKNDWLGEWRLETREILTIDEFDGDLLFSGEGSDLGPFETNHGAEYFKLSAPGWKTVLSKDFRKLKISGADAVVICEMKTSDFVICTAFHGKIGLTKQE